MLNFLLRGLALLAVLSGISGCVTVGTVKPIDRVEITPLHERFGKPRIFLDVKANSGNLRGSPLESDADARAELTRLFRQYADANNAFASIETDPFLAQDAHLTVEIELTRREMDRPFLYEFPGIMLSGMTFTLIPDKSTDTRYSARLRVSPRKLRPGRLDPYEHAYENRTVGYAGITSRLVLPDVNPSNTWAYESVIEHIAAQMVRDILESGMYRERSE